MEITTTKTLSNVELLPLSITELYDYIAIKLGYDKDKVHYDCTKINVSTDIADLVEEKYKQIAREKGLPDDTWKMSFGMDWCCYGPIARKEFDKGTIIVYDGFIEEGEQ